MPVSKKTCEGLTDEDLVRESLQNIEYFACLFERYEKKLIRYILRISSFLPEEANDILQEAFIKIWVNLNKFDDNLKFSSWAYRIVHNTVVSEWKKSRSFGKDRNIKISEEVFKNLPSEFDLIEKFYEKDKIAIIHKILSSLPEKYRDVLVLKFLEGKNYNEISDILRKPPGTIATLIHRAKKAFRKEVDKKDISFSV
jgi:RNA polymerase sigma-70 factor (ECF subfamily)